MEEMEVLITLIWLLNIEHMYQIAVTYPKEIH